MKELKEGEFFGTHYQKSTFENLIITDTEYIHNKVDWHYHENPYFTYLLQGKLFEANKKESHYLEPGSLLFHNCEDAHYNVKPSEYTRGFHIEINPHWFSKFDLESSDFNGVIDLANPLIKNLANQIFMETKTNDQYSKLSIESSLISMFNLLYERDKKEGKKPIWIGNLKDLLMEDEINYSLHSLSSNLDIHPVHLSREFSRYFGTNLGNYIRLTKLNKAFYLIISKKYSMTEICYKCGFYDQSHFISNFKKAYKMTPTNLLKTIGC